MNKQNIKRFFRSIVCIILVFTLVFTSIPTGVFSVYAEETPVEVALEEGPSESTEEPYIIGEDLERRGLNEKHFIMSDGTMIAALYDTAVHYKDTDGTYKDIDNSLSEFGGELETNSGISKIKLSKKTSSKKIVSITKDGYKISWGYEDVSKTKAEIKNNTGSDDDKMNLKKLVTEAMYENAFNDADLQYVISSDSVKENIILNGVDAPNEYVINYDIGKLSARQIDEKTVELYDENEVVYTVSAPIMTDNNGECSQDVILEILEQKNGKMTLSLVADKSWIEDSSREFPIVVDPSVQFSQSSSTLMCKTSFTADPDSISNIEDVYNMSTQTLLGWDDVLGDMCSLYYFNSLPTLSSGDYIVDAVFSVGTSDVLDVPVYLYETTDLWRAETEYAINYEPAYDERVVDYHIPTTTAYDWNITNLVRKWYDLGIPHSDVCGMMLKVGAFTTNNVAIASSYYSTVGARPVLAISYVNHTGVEEYLSYTNVNVGSGTGYVDNATGNLVLDVPIVSTSGENSPTSINFYFNGTNATELSNTVCGKGWRMNFDQRIDPVTNQTLKDAGYEYTYTDIDGTVNYMKKESGSANTYSDEIGAGLKLEISSTQWTLTDKDNNICYFDTTGKLTKQKGGSTSSAITLTYDSNGYLQKITDGAGDTLTVERHETNHLVTAIYDSYNRKIQFSYSSYRLIKIINFDGAVTTFTYNDNGQVTSVTDPSGDKVQFDYEQEDAPGWKNRVTSAKRFSLDTTENAFKNSDFLIFSYTQEGTTSVLDGNAIRVCYAFDNYGRANNCWSETGATSSYYKQDVSNNLSYLNHKVERETYTPFPVENLAQNNSFETSSYWSVWTDNSGSSGGSLSAEQSYLGEYSYKLYASSSSSTTLYQVYTPKKSGYYTYSVYYKTSGITYASTLFEGGISVLIARIHNDNTKEYVRSTITSAATGDGWQRISVTAYVDISDVKQIHFINGLHYAIGSVYFDCAQFEYSKTANEYNMLYNSRFDEGATGWSSDGLSPIVDNINEFEPLVCNDYPLEFEKVYVLYSSEYLENSFYQTVNINKKASKVALNFSAYAHANACKSEDNDALFALKLTFNFSDGTSESIVRSFDVTNWSWQRLTELIMPSDANKNKTVSTAKAEFCYSKQQNWVEVTGLQLAVDTSGKIYSYDDKGNPISAVDTAENSVSSVYDSNNRLTQKTMQDGATYNYSYESSVNDRLVSSVIGPKDQQTDYTYNNYSQVTSTSVSNSTETSMPKMVSSTAYTSNGKLVQSQTDAIGNTVTNQYDAYDRLKTVSNDDTDSSDTTTYTYDSSDRIKTVTQKASSTSGESTVEYTYDNYMLSSITHNGFDYSFSYDVYGNKTQTKVGNRVLSTNTYSTEADYGSEQDTYRTPDKLVKSTYGNGDYVEYDYDSHKRVIGKKVNGTETVRYIYNDTGNIGEVKDLVNNISYLYYYDNLGRVETISASNRLSVRYTYDGSNRVVGTYYTYEGDSKSVTNVYETGGFLKSSAISGNTTVNYAYDYLARVSSQTVTASAGNNWVTQYGYYNPTSDTTTQLVNSANHTNIGLNITYSYDNLGNITEIKENDLLKADFVYDNLGQLIRENNVYSGKTVTYTYDLGGNILTKTEYTYTTGGLDGITGTVINYTYGDSQWKDLLTAYNGSTITYDAIGNPLSYYNGNTFTWQNGRQLATATTLSGKNITYKYNDSGIRTKKIINGTETNYLLDGGSIIREQTGSKTMWFYYDGSGSLTALDYNGTRYYYYYNACGDVIGLYDANLNSVVTYTYDSWGKLLNIGGSLATTLGTDNPFRYRGYYYDTETGLYYVSSRYYDPEIGRWINADGQLITGSDIIGMNLFAYCGNNPVNRIDRTGEAWWHWALGAAVVVACAAATIITAGGFMAAAGAVAAVSSGVAAATVASTVAATAFVGAATAYGTAVISAATTSKSVKDFNDQGNWGTVAQTAVGAATGAIDGLASGVSKNKTPSTKSVGKGMQNPKTKAAVLKGQEMHKKMNYGSNVIKEKKIYPGCRVDGIDFENRIIYELKPNNSQAINRGLNQLDRYVEAAEKQYGGTWTGVLELYD